MLMASSLQNTIDTFQTELKRLSKKRIQLTARLQKTIDAANTKKARASLK